jgi:hypothetical protein
MAIKIIIPSKIKTKKIEFNLKDQQKKELFVQSFDYVPFLFLSKINTDIGCTVDPKSVIYVKLHNSRFLPEIELSCYDPIGVFFTDLYPFDHDSLLSIFVKSNSEMTMPIRMDFRVTQFETIKASDKDFKRSYLIRGILDVDELHYTRYESRKGTSFNILKDIALQMNLGWATNIANSNDEMIWINPSETYIDFIKDTTKRSYIDDKSFVWTFIDFQYNLTYVNIELELNENNRDEKQTITNPQLTKKPEEQTVDLYLTNNPAFKETNKYINKFNLINQSFGVNLDKSYRMKSTWYDKNENKTYREFLKDLETEDKDVADKKLINLYDYNSPIYNENINDDYYIGKLDTDNVHKNYAIAKPINEFNIENIGKMKMIVTLNKVNFSIKRFQNTRVEIYNINDMFSKDANEKSPEDNINIHLSGYWFVTGINYLYRRTGGTEQEITLVRRDLDVNYSIRSDIRKTMNELKPQSTPNK